MVRLKETSALWLLPIVTMFQFQNGTIKSGDIVSHMPDFYASFNSKMVRLKVSKLLE